MTTARHTYGFFAGLSRGLGWLIGQWKLLLIAAFFISPIGPHLRVTYVWNGDHQRPYYHQCTYLGSRGFADPQLTPNCPLFAIVDARDWQG